MDFEKHCWAEIDLDALSHNFETVRAVTGKPVCAVVKADAYGHGDVAVARVLQEKGAAAFAVSCFAEARHLRRRGIIRPLLVLGYTDPSLAAELAKYNIITSVFSLDYARSLSAAAVATGVIVPVHLKIDTGMGRIGFTVCSDFSAALAALKEVCALPGLAVEGIFQHFAVADSTAPADDAYTEAQHALFEKTVAALAAAGCPTGVVHCANSAAQVRRTDWRSDWVRAGILLYGLAPSEDVPLPALRPVMTLKCIVTMVKDLLPGQSVCYGRRYTAPSFRRVATVCVGYADGYSRLLSGPGGGVMMVRGRAAPVLGRVCMDQTVLDVTGIPGVAMGDEVTVFGPGAPDTADTIAQKTGTIPYEVVCALSRRVPRIYRKNGSVTEIWNDLED